MVLAYAPHPWIVFTYVGALHLGGRHSTEVAFALLTQPSRVRFSHLTASKNRTQKSCSENLPFYNLFGVSALWDRTKKPKKKPTTSSCRLRTLDSLSIRADSKVEYRCIQNIFSFICSLHNEEDFSQLSYFQPSAAKDVLSNKIEFKISSSWE